MITSMTGFASAKGASGVHGWAWELRSVNGKGLDLRLRIPDWLEGLEAALRAELSRAVSRGNISLTLRVQRDDTDAAAVLNVKALEAALAAIAQIESTAALRGMPLAPSRATDILSLRGMMDGSTDQDDVAALVASLKADFAHLVAAFVEMRQTEGRALAGVLASQLDQVEALTAKAADLAEARRDQVADTLTANLARVLDNSEGADPARVAQELALLAVKADVTEELDRLTAHVAAARDLLARGGAVGRKLDFLMQEFNREANTLCSKAQSSALTAVGLDLKAVIDQMREQVQNIE